jgi:putative SOS response-associated peptidase YedK
MYGWRELVELYWLTMAAPSNLQPRYNICPTDTIDVVVSGSGESMLVPMRWGLVPGWWKKPLKDMKVATFNARSDTIADKPMFRDSFKRRRCLIPASGYYEWVTTPEGKQPYYFTRRDGQVITIAGLQDGWTDPQSGERLRSCSMVITDANKFVSDIHDRMPVILEAVHFEQWMDGDANDAAALMKPADEALLQKWPVSRRVNSSRADGDDATLIEKVDVPTQRSSHPERRGSGPRLRR